MYPILRNILAVIAGFIAGSFLNGSLISIGGFIIPPPEGTDTSTMEGLQTAIRLFEPKHFIFPFLAHALGTLVGAFVAVKISANRELGFAMVVGLFFLVGGIINIYLLPSPLWFTIVDLVVAYIPMASIGWLLAKKKVN